MTVKPTFLLAIIGLAIAALVGYHGVYARQREHARLIEQQIAEQRSHQGAAEELAALAQQLDTYRKRLPPEPDASWLARHAVTLTKEAGVQLTGITQETPQSLQQFTRLAVRLQFSASYHQLGTLIDAIERSEPFIRVERLEISPAAVDGASQRAIELVLSTVYLPPLEAAPAS